MFDIKFVQSGSKELKKYSKFEVSNSIGATIRFAEGLENTPFKLNRTNKYRINVSSCYLSKRTEAKANQDINFFT